MAERLHKNAAAEEKSCRKIFLHFLRRHNSSPLSLLYIFNIVCKEKSGGYRGMEERAEYKLQHPSVVPVTMGHLYILNFPKHFPRNAYSSHP